MKKKLLSLLFGIFVIFAVSGSVFSQTLYFCEGVSDNGQPITQSTTFNIPSGGGYFYFLVRMPYEVGCTSVRYEIYDIDYYGNESYNTTIYQDDMKTNWTWFWKKVTFYTPGEYKVYAIDCNGYTLTSEYLTIKIK